MLDEVVVAAAELMRDVAEVDLRLAELTLNIHPIAAAVVVVVVVDDLISRF